jgi:hypothetical protein
MDYWKLIKLFIFLLLIGGVLWWLYFTWILQNLTLLIWSINNNFFAYIPVQYIYLFSFLVFAIIYLIITSYMD